jgi:4-amino-4-deoxychorismate lyase
LYMFLNGEVVPSEKATISIFDHGYLYGVGLFETFRTYGGVPFLLTDHLSRLEEGCMQVGMVWKKEKEEHRMREQISCLLEKNRLTDGYFRLNVSAGANPIGLPTSPYTNLTEALFIKELPFSAQNKKLQTVNVRRNSPEGEFRLKSHHYLNNIMAKKETPGQAEGVFLTHSGKVAEGIVSNLFFVKNNELYTPGLSTGILNGITRMWVMKSAMHLGIKLHQGEYDLEYAQEADEVFVTNSIQEIVPVTEWDAVVYKIYKDHLYPNQTVTSRLIQLYEKCKGKLDQIKNLNDFLKQEG